MCFSIPKKVKMVKDGVASTEDGKSVRLGELREIVSGDYLRVYGNAAVEKIDKKEACDIRKTIKHLNLKAR